MEDAKRRELHIRMTRYDMDILRKLADKHEMTVSSYIRAVIRTNYKIEIGSNIGRRMPS
jgi:hypothetical protein